jgi:Domain of unknown function (DUF1840)
MLYKFKSPATGDLIMLGPQGDQMLRILGREPAPQGIIDAAAMPNAIAALQAAIAQAEKPADRDDGDKDGVASVGLRQRLWPMVEMLRAAHAADVAVVWGV